MFISTIKVRSSTFCKSLAEGIRHHVGTAVFGSLIIAIIQTIRSVMGYIQKRLKKTNNRVTKAILCCLQCFFWCLEKCMEFINKNAYIQLAIFSTSFCRSSKNAFWLIARNLSRISAVTVVTDFVALIMKLVISLGTAGAMYVFLEEFMEDDLYSPMGPVLFVGVMAYLVADTFAGLLGMTALTILQCFIADEEMFAPGERYARNDLKAWLQKNEGERGGEGAIPRLRVLSGTIRNDEPNTPRSPKTWGQRGQQ